MILKKKDKDNKLPSGEHFQLTCNANGHQIGETFTREQAEKSGIDPGCFAPWKGATDRAVKSENVTKR